MHMSTVKMARPKEMNDPALQHCTVLPSLKMGGDQVRPHLYLWEELLAGGRTHTQPKIVVAQP